MKTGIVYCLTNRQTGKQYVGITTRSLQKRFTEHKNDATRRRTPLHRSMRLHGTDKFDATVLQRGVPENELQSLETQYINQLNTFVPHGYNLLSNHDGKLTWHESSRAKASATHLARQSDPVVREASAQRIRATMAIPRNREAYLAAMKVFTPRPNKAAFMRKMYESEEARIATGQRTRDFHERNPEARKAMGEKTRILFADPDYRARHQAAVKAGTSTMEARIARARTHSAKSVLAPDGRVFLSALEASLSFNCAQTTMAMRCRHNRCGFAYIEKEATS